MPDVEAELRARAESDGVEFFFAMFVDMHGKPCAKMIPVTALDVLLGGARLRRVRGRADGAEPGRPGHDRGAGPGVVHARAVAAGAGRAAVRHPGRGRAVAVYAAPDPEGDAGQGARARLRLQRGLRGGVLPGPSAATRAASSWPTRSTGPSVPCYDAKGLTRMFDHLSTVSRYMNQLGWANYANDHEDANGQFEQNFAYADALTSADRLIFFRYMVHTLAHRAGMAATFMPKPFGNLTGSGLHLHSSLWDAQTGAELFADPADARGPRPVGARLPLHRRADRARPRPWPPSPARRSTPTSASGSARRSPAPPGPRPTPPTAGTTAPRCCGCPRAAGWRTGPATARPTRTWPWRSSWPPGSTASTAASTRASRTATTCTSCLAEEVAAAASGRCRRPCCTRPTSWSPTTCCARRSARRRTGTTSTTTPRSSARSSSTWHSVVSDWEVERYLTLF